MAIKYTQSPQQQQVFAALLPMLQRLGVAGGSSANNPYLNRYNQGLNAWSGRAPNYPTVSRANMPTRSMPYASRATHGMNSQKERILATINKKRIAQGLPPITLSQLNARGA